MKMRFADQVVRRLRRVVGVVLDHRAEDVRGGLVQAAGLLAVDQVGGGVGHAVAHFVAHDVDRHQRTEFDAVAVAEGHAEAVFVPEGVDVVLRVMHEPERADAVAADAFAAEGLLVEVPGLGEAVGGIDRRRRAVGLRPLPHLLSPSTTIVPNPR